MAAATADYSEVGASGDRMPVPAVALELQTTVETVTSLEVNVSVTGSSEGGKAIRYCEMEGGGSVSSG